MKAFILNRGSSSIKCFLYQKDIDHPLWTAHLEWKNQFDQAIATIKNERGDHFEEPIQEKSAERALQRLTQLLTHGKTAALKSLNEVDVIGHRIVHGGKEFSRATLITQEVKEKLRRLSELAPLHNASELEDVAILESLFKNKPPIAIFDTAFHHTLPQAAKVYPGPYKWIEEGIERYGFHGISFQYCSRKAAEMIKEHNLKMVICHLGSGASLCAVQEGKSIDTTMGFTPLEGLMMDTRSGSLDPGILLHLFKKKTSEQLSHELYEESGLLGLSGISSDMRDIIEKGSQGNARAKLAFDVYIHRLNSCIGSMIASLKGLDVLVFTAGIGENAAIVREVVCNSFVFLGIKLDKAKNGQTHAEDCELSAADSKIKVLLIHTQEALEIARECWKLINKTNDFDPGRIL